MIMYAPANSSIKTSCQRCQDYFFSFFLLKYLMFQEVLIPKGWGMKVGGKKGAGGGDMFL